MGREVIRSAVACQELSSQLWSFHRGAGIDGCMPDDQAMKVHSDLFFLPFLRCCKRRDMTCFVIMSLPIKSTSVGSNDRGNFV
jgi:hypothetical protein